MSRDPEFDDLCDNDGSYNTDCSSVIVSTAIGNGNCGFEGTNCYNDMGTENDGDDLGSSGENNQGYIGHVCSTHDSVANAVTNNDDPDDNCKSNKLDDCGVCDGFGRVTWFRDKDGDGLGTFMEWVTSCTYPTEMEIENYNNNEKE